MVSSGKSIIIKAGVKSSLKILDPKYRLKPEQVSIFKVNIPLVTLILHSFLQLL